MTSSTLDEFHELKFDQMNFVIITHLESVLYNIKVSKVIYESKGYKSYFLKI